jgi:hypothetical protein
MLYPFKVSVFSGHIATQYPAGQYEMQQVVLALKNRAYRRISDCVVHIMGIDGINNSTHIFPRLVDKFPIDSGETKKISIMYRTFRRAPLTNDSDITVAGPVSPGFCGNVLHIPPAGYIVSVRIGTPETEALDMKFSVQTDDATLHAELHAK